MDLINDLENDHKEIITLLEKLKMVNNTDVRISLIKESKEMLLSHLEKEDKYLYPALNEKAKTDKSLKLTLNTFGAEMDKISDFIKDFYSKYSNQAFINKESFNKDITTFIVAIKNRIMKEEVAIYKAYLKLKN